MQFHGGLRVYYHLLRISWRSIKDFGLWFVYVMLVLSATVIMVFQVSALFVHSSVVFLPWTDALLADRRNKYRHTQTHTWLAGAHRSLVETSGLPFVGKVC